MKKRNFPVRAGPGLWWTPGQVNDPPPADRAGCPDYAVFDAVVFHRRADTAVERMCQFTSEHKIKLVMTRCAPRLAGTSDDGVPPQSVGRVLWRA